MMTRWMVGVAMLAACGGGSGGASDSASAGTSSSSSGGGTDTATASGSASHTSPTGAGETGGGATQGADDSSGGSTDPGPTTGSSAPGSSGAETDAVSGTSTSTSTSSGETSTGAGETEGSTGASETGETDPGSSSTGIEPDTEGGMVDTQGRWLVMFEDTSSPTRLYKIDMLDGHATLLCSLDTNNNYNTSTFGRDGTLYAANADTKNLESIDPCTCARKVIGPTNVNALPGITTDQGLGLYGLETTVNQLMTISTINGNAQPVGPLGLNWGTGGLTWSDDLKSTYAINGADDRLYTIDHLTGKATMLVQTNYNFGSVGIEWHPKTQEIFACSNPAELLRVEALDGTVTLVGPMLLENKQAHCDNLAAPWVPIACVEDK